MDFLISGSKRKRLPTFLLIAFIYAGNDLRSHTLSRAVPSALRGLTSVFGMGTGGSPAVRSPTTCCSLPAAFATGPVAIPSGQRLAANFKDREGNASQLNRLGKTLQTSRYEASRREAHGYEL